MDVSSLGEDSLIAYVAAKFKTDVSLEGIGDDCAVIPLPGTEDLVQLVSTDSLLEGTHFTASTITMQNLGYKAVQVNVSDIAAMGGCPQYLFLSLGLPKNMPDSDFFELMEGIKEACCQASVQLLGGDTVASQNGLTLNLTIMGIGHAASIKYRRCARAKDIVCVTGTLGDSAAGLQLLLQRSFLMDDPSFLPLKRAHQRPTAQVAEGRWLAAQSGVTAMMDVSDGLYTDLSRLAKASQCGALIHIDRLPLSMALQKAATSEGWDAGSVALAGGEEYCLLCSIDSDTFFEVQQHYEDQFGRPLYPIGHLTTEKQVVLHKEGKVYEKVVMPFQHF
jgi:thiamine-monophosphate kinase